MQELVIIPIRVYPRLDATHSHYRCAEEMFHLIETARPPRA